MTLTDFIFRAAVIYVILGTAAGFGSVLSGARAKGVLLSFLCWPVIAWYGLRLLIERATR